MSGAAAPCRAAVAGLVLLALGACAIPTATPAPDGRLLVLGPTSGFSASDLPEDWTRAGAAPETARLEVATVDGVQALRARMLPGEPPAPVVVGRRVQGMLLATPYLRWGWWMRGGNGPGAGALPMRLFVAFHGGDPARPSYTAEAPRWLGAELPPFDRVIELVWATTGTAPLPSPAEGAVARHAVRAGSGGLGRWQLESVDLAALYGALWPGDDAGRARIMFIGVRVTTAPSAATAAVAEVMLGR